MFPYFPNKIQKMNFPEPVEIIYHLRPVGNVLTEIKIFFQLFPDSLQIMVQGGFIQQISFLTFTTGVADHSCSPSDQRNWLMPCLLQMDQQQDGYQTSDMQTVCCRVKSDISGGHFPGKLFFGTGHDIL